MVGANTEGVRDKQLACLGRERAGRPKAVLARLGQDRLHAVRTFLRRALGGRANERVDRLDRLRLGERDERRILLLERGCRLRHPHEARQPTVADVIPGGNAGLLPDDHAQTNVDVSFGHVLVDRVDRESRQVRLAGRHDDLGLVSGRAVERALRDLLQPLLSLHADVPLSTARCLARAGHFQQYSLETTNATVFSVGRDEGRVLGLSIARAPRTERFAVYCSRI